MMSDEEVNKFGKFAFEVYAECRQNKTFDGKLIPKWDNLPLDIREAWCVSAVMVIEEYSKQMIIKVKDIIDNKENPFVNKFGNIDLSKLENIGDESSES